MLSSTVFDQRPAFCKFHSNYLITSTYQLNSDSNSRTGAFYFLKPDLSTQRVVTTPAGVFRFEILDQTCVSALTDGSIHVVNLSDFTTTNVKVAEDMLLNVSVYKEKAVVTTNKGQIYLMNYPSGEVISSWIGHKLPYTSDPCEIWSVALSENILCTGGEDSLLTFWDLRTSSKTGSAKLFDAGVTFIRRRDDNVFVTGSYDQNIRLLDARNLRDTFVKTETAGGVWHIESRGEGSAEQHLAACMYGGFAVLDADWKITQENTKAGEELLYGVTFVDHSTIACTTFNDYRIALYTLQDKTL